jgi:hypothetical protein
MPPVRTQKKKSSPEAFRGRDLSHFGFKPLPKAEAAAAPATIPTPPSPPADHGTVASHKETTVPQNSPALQSPPSSSNVPAVQEAPKPKSRLPKPVKQGQKEAFFQDSRRNWDGRHLDVIGTSTRKITFGCGFKLAE